MKGEVVALAPSFSTTLFNTTTMKHKKHGLSTHPLYRVWAAQKTRCYNSNYHEFKYWGGRGITMSNEFRNDFKLWFDYVTLLPNFGIDGYTLDRIDNDGHYERGNLRWASKTVQSVNQMLQKNNKSGFVGVYKRGLKWSSSIRVGKDKIHFGSFNTIREAVDVRNYYIKANNLHQKIQ